MSAPVVALSRSSYHATIAPPAALPMRVGTFWLFMAVQIGRFTPGSAGHWARTEPVPHRTTRTVRSGAGFIVSGLYAVTGRSGARASLSINTPGRQLVPARGFGFAFYHPGA